MFAFGMKICELDIIVLTFSAIYPWLNLFITHHNMFTQFFALKGIGRIGPLFLITSLWLSAKYHGSRCDLYNKSRALYL
jgi:hypothetical protein